MAKERVRLCKMGGGPKIVSTPIIKWTTGAEAAFFAELARSCNVAKACRTVGISEASAYRRRANNSAFRRRWAAAITEAYATLEQVMIERAINGDRKPVFHQGRKTATFRDYPDRIAIALYTRHGQTVPPSSATGRSAAEVDAMRIRLAQRLLRMKDGDKASAITDHGDA